MATDPSEEYYYGDFGEQIKRSNALDEGDDMTKDESEKPADDATVPVPSASDVDNAFQERLSTERSDRDSSPVETIEEAEMDEADEPKARDISE